MALEALTHSLSVFIFLLVIIFIFRFFFGILYSEQPIQQPLCWWEKKAIAVPTKYPSAPPMHILMGGQFANSLRVQLPTHKPPTHPLSVFIFLFVIIFIFRF